MASLSFDDLVAAEKTKGLKFTAKGGAEVLLRTITTLPKKDRELVLTLVKSMEKDSDDVDKMEEIVEQVLITAADKKDPMKRSLTALQLDSKIRILRAWMEEIDLPEA